ncbi:MAG TPA: outer membrane channel, partial [Thermodesulfobacteriota bacterium]|nr:outer membrane channel [Thermodesulfobacteriota bacterium]
SGLQIWVGGISINPLSGLNVTLRAHHSLANKVPSGFSKDVGTEVDLDISYKLRKGISFILGLNKFYTGRFFEEASGSNKNMEYIYIQAEVEF